MKNKKIITVIVFLAISIPFQLSADCVNSCGSINDGKCNGTTVDCERETDKTKANCNAYDSLFGCIGGV